MTDESARVMHLAEELRALAANGIAYHVNGYDLERYRRLQGIAAELLSLVDTRSTVELERLFRGDLTVRTPLTAADAAIFDAKDRILLVQRVDSGQWCMPGGAADVGEAPSRVAEREAYEETGLTVRARRLLGVYDNRAYAGPPPALHLYHLVFECEWLDGEPVLSNETTDVRWVTAEQASALPLFRTHVRKVPAAFELHRHQDAAARFD